LCARLDELVKLGYPVLVGPSRKSFIARAAADEGAAPAPPARRLGGTIAAVLACVDRGAAIVRVHDVEPVVQAIALSMAMKDVVVRRAPTHRAGAEHTEFVRREAARDA